MSASEHLQTSIDFAAPIAILQRAESCLQSCAAPSVPWRKLSNTVAATSAAQAAARHTIAASQAMRTSLASPATPGSVPAAEGSGIKSRWKALSVGAHPSDVDSTHMWLAFQGGQRQAVSPAAADVRACGLEIVA